MTLRRKIAAAVLALLVVLVVAATGLLLWKTRAEADLPGLQSHRDAPPAGPDTARLRHGLRRRVRPDERRSAPRGLVRAHGERGRRHRAARLQGRPWRDAERGRHAPPPRVRRAHLLDSRARPQRRPAHHLRQEGDVRSRRVVPPAPGRAGRRPGAHRNPRQLAGRIAGHRVRRAHAGHPRRGGQLRVLLAGRYRSTRASASSRACGPSPSRRSSSSGPSAKRAFACATSTPHAGLPGSVPAPSC